MSLQDIIDGLTSLLRDRQAFLTGDSDHDAIFQHDISCLTWALEVLTAAYDVGFRLSDQLRLAIKHGINRKTRWTPK